MNNDVRNVAVMSNDRRNVDVKNYCDPYRDPIALGPTRDDLYIGRLLKGIVLDENGSFYLASDLGKKPIKVAPIIEGLGVVYLSSHSGEYQPTYNQALEAALGEFARERLRGFTIGDLEDGKVGHELTHGRREVAVRLYRILE